MTRTWRVGLTVAAIAIAAASLQAQFRSSTEWTTSRFDAQRTAWVRTDGRLTKDAVEKGTFQFLWKAKFDNEARQLNTLGEPILLDLLIGYRGFKSLAFVGGSADRIFSIDTDLAKPYWMASLNYTASTGGQPASSPECPGGLMATPSRRTQLAPSSFGAAPGGGAAAFRGGGSASAVGQPGKGAAVLSQARPPQPAAPPRTNEAAPQAPVNPVLAPVGFGGVDSLWVMGADGYLRTLRVSDGLETTPPIPFIPPSSKPSSLLVVEGIVYTSTSNGCGAAPNAVWAIDLTTSDKKPVSWRTGGASVVGTAGPAFGTDGTLFVAVGAGPATGTNRSTSTDGQGADVSYSNAVVALDRHTLRPKDWFTADGANFITSPTVVRYKDKDLIAVGASDGKLYLLDGASLGGNDHKTPMFVGPTGGAGASTGAGAALATWDDGSARWILTATAKSIVALKVVDQNGRIALENGWQSRDLDAPLAPIVVNGMVMAVSSGEYRGTEKGLTSEARAQKSTPAALYVLDGLSGKELFNSGKTITSFARAGMSAGGGQVYLVTYDNHLYAFGIPMEH
jgi:hypothetical protein